jgi:hypothetical protein
MVRKTDIAIFVGIPQGRKRGKKAFILFSLYSYHPVANIQNDETKSDHILELLINHRDSYSDINA